MKRSAKEAIKQLAFNAMRLWGMCYAKHSVKSYECDSNGNMRVSILMNLFQNTAEMHISKIGLGVEFCRELDLAWVASKYHIKIHRYPVAKEKIKIKTWMAAKTTAVVTKQFAIFGQDGEMIVKASSQWSLISFSKRKLVSLTDNLPWFRLRKASLWTEAKALVKLAKIPKLDVFAKIKNVEVKDFQLEFPVKREHIDFNKHVNNAFYLMWAVESADEKYYEGNHHPVEIRIDFKKEALYGEMVNVQTQIDELDSTHVIQTENKELARVQITWA